MWSMTDNANFCSHYIVLCTLLLNVGSVIIVVDDVNIINDLDDVAYGVKNITRRCIHNIALHISTN